MSKQTMYDKVKLLGVEVDCISQQDAIEYICDQATPGRPSCYVVKPYVEFLDRARRSAEIQALLNGAELSLADGVALVWAAAYLYAGPRTFWRFWQTLAQIVLAPEKLRWPIPDRTAGINFTWPLLEEARRQNLHVYIIGQPKGGDIQATAKCIAEHVPGINIVGTAPGLDPASTPGQVSDSWLENTAQSIAEANADLVLIGMGFPLQEKVCAYLASHTNHGVFVGEGGTFDYESFGGIRPKAPAWMQRVGLEWLWRLVLEPRRIIRQLAIPRFIWNVWRIR